MFTLAPSDKYISKPDGETSSGVFLYFGRQASDDEFFSFIGSKKMAFVTLYDGTSYVHVEATEEFAREYVEMERRDKLIERKETRRHQSLDKSLENGWDVPDPRMDIPPLIERKELQGLIRRSMETLTEKQRIIFRLYFWEELNFREIGELLGLHEDTPRKHYIAAKKKLQKFFQNYSGNHDPRG